MEQNRPFGEICIDSVWHSMLRLCGAVAMSLRSMGPEWFSNCTSCAMHMSVVRMRFPRAACLHGWWLEMSGALFSRSRAASHYGGIMDLLPCCFRVLGVYRCL